MNLDVTIQMQYRDPTNAACKYYSVRMEIDFQKSIEMAISEIQEERK